MYSDVFWEKSGHLVLMVNFDWLVMIEGTVSGAQLSIVNDMDLSTKFL